MSPYQAVLRIDSTDPPGNESGVVAYVKEQLEKEGIATETFQLEANRPNLVARLKGNGSKRPLLIMAHTDTVNVDPTKWPFPPFSATRDGGYVYGRGAVDNKQDVAAALMTMLRLKREKVALDRDVIFLAEAGGEGTTRVGSLFMANPHLPASDPGHSSPPNEARPDTDRCRCRTTRSRTSQRPSPRPRTGYHPSG